MIPHVQKISLEIVHTTRLRTNIWPLFFWSGNFLKNFVIEFWTWNLEKCISAKNCVFKLLFPTCNLEISVSKSGVYMRGSGVIAALFFFILEKFMLSVSSLFVARVRLRISISHARRVKKTVSTEDIFMANTQSYRWDNYSRFLFRINGRIDGKQKGERESVLDW